MKQAAVILLFLATTTGTIQADEVVHRIVFHGAREFSAAQLQKYFALPLRVPLAADTIRDRTAALADSLVTSDYLFARVDTFWFRERHGRQELNVQVREGPPARVAAYRWLGDSTRVPREVAERALVRSGERFRWRDLALDMERLLDHFESSGYPFARVEIARIDANEGAATVDVWLQISSGPVTRLDFVSFGGNRSTRAPVLFRETRLRKGEPYDQRRMDLAKRRLQRLDYVRRVQPAELVVNESGETGALFRVEESRSTLIDIAAGYQPAGQDRPGQVSGLANLEFMNLFGTGRRGRIHWERPNSSVQAVEVAYAEPWVLGQPITLRGEFGQRIHDTLYVQRHYGIQAGYDLSTQLTVWGLVRREAVFADSESAALLGLPDSRTTYLESGIALDTRDEPLNPRGGVYWSSYVGNGWRNQDPSGRAALAGSFRQQRGGVDAEVAHEVVPFWIVAGGVHARATRSTEPEILLPDLYRVGGARTLRGYREEQFLGSRVGWASLEIRYWLGPLSRLFVFGDAGGIHREQLVNGAPVASTLYRSAAGLGLRLETNMGVWGIDYGIGEEDRVLDGKLHISLLSSF